jgi:hypothetical protein
MKTFYALLIIAIVLVPSVALADNSSTCPMIEVRPRVDIDNNGEVSPGDWPPIALDVYSHIDFVDGGSTSFNFNFESAFAYNVPLCVGDILSVNTDYSFVSSVSITNDIVSDGFVYVLLTNRYDIYLPVVSK